MGRVDSLLPYLSFSLAFPFPFCFIDPEYISGLVYWLIGASPSKGVNGDGTYLSDSDVSRSGSLDYSRFGGCRSFGCQRTGYTSAGSD